MRLQIHAENCELMPELYSRIELRIQFAMGRFSQRIARIDLSLSDEDDDRGKIAKSCRLVVKLSPCGMVTTQDRDSDVTRLIDRVVNRSARSVGLQLKRRRMSDPRT